jgi:hypothetical protein
MSSAITLLGLSATVAAITNSCGDASVAPTCPIETMMDSCSTLATDTQGNQAALCASSCLQTVSANFDVCAGSTDPRVTALFSADNWRPLINLCDSTDSAIGTQCNHIQAGMTAHIASACCVDSMCAATPTSCRAECSGVLLPYFRSCGSSLLISDAALMARLTTLANLCAGGGH